MFTRPWRIAIYGILGVLFLVTLTGCSDDQLFDIEVPAHIKGGTTARAYIKPVKGFPDDAEFIWSGNGVEVFQESARHLIATITAPNNPGPSDILATVTCKVQHDGKTLGIRTVALNITPGGNDVAAAKTAPPVDEINEPNSTATHTPEITPTVPKVQTETPEFPSGPQVLITEVPAVGPGGLGPPSEWISGKVSGVTPEEYRVVVYAHTDFWYVQPYVRPEPGLGAPDGPLTRIESDGTWNTPTRTGSEYAVLLVKRSYKPPATVFALPAIGGNILSVAKVKGR